MVTKNPKISVYVPDEIKEKLIEAKEERRSHSLSAVVVEILEEFFEVSKSQGNAINNALVEQINSRFKSHDLRISKLEEDQRKKEKEEVLQLQLDSATTQRNAEVTQKNNAKVAEGNAKAKMDDNSFVVSTVEVTQLTGIKAKKLDYAKKKNKMPVEHEGWLITFVEKTLIDGRNVNTWRVTKT